MTMAVPVTPGREEREVKGCPAAAVAVEASSPDCCAVRRSQREGEREEGGGGGGRWRGEVGGAVGRQSFTAVAVSLKPMLA